MSKTNSTLSRLLHDTEISCPSWCPGEPDDPREPHYGFVLHFQPALMDEADLTVAIRQGRREISPRITVVPDLLEHGPGMAFTVAEAEQFAEALLKAVKQARKG